MQRTSSTRLTLDTIRRLVVAAEYKDRATAEHIQRNQPVRRPSWRSSFTCPPATSRSFATPFPCTTWGRSAFPTPSCSSRERLSPEERTLMNSTHSFGGPHPRRLAIGAPESGRDHRSQPSRMVGRKRVSPSSAGESIPLWGRICALRGRNSTRSPPTGPTGQPFRTRKPSPPCATVEALSSILPSSTSSRRTWLSSSPSGSEPGQKAGKPGVEKGRRTRGRSPPPNLQPPARPRRHYFEVRSRTDIAIARNLSVARHGGNSKKRRPYSWPDR